MNLQTDCAITLRVLMSMLTSIAVALLATVWTTRVVAQTEQWTEFHDARIGVTVSHPRDWSVSAAGYAILVRSKDQSSIAFMEAFKSESGESAKDHIVNAVGAHAGLFPQAKIKSSSRQESKADQVLDIVKYQTSGGKPATARILCSVFQGSGILYGIGSSDEAMPARSAVLVKVLNSIRFGAAGSTPVKVTGGAANAAKLHFISFVDPKEQSFKVEVPEGWKVDGGAFRMGSTDIRQTVRANSDDGITVRLGDPGLPSMMTVPNASMRSYGVREGQIFRPSPTYVTMYLRYMSALEFNRWYLDQAVRANVPDMTITAEQDMPEEARAAAEPMNRNPGIPTHTDITIATTRFKGHVEKTAKPIAGVILSQVSSWTNAAGARFGWTPRPYVIAWPADAAENAHRATAMAAFQHMFQTWTVSLTWALRANAQGIQDTNANIKRSDEAITRSREAQLKANRETEQRTHDLAAAFAKHMGEGDFQAGNFRDYVNDEQQVRNPTTGTTYKATAGYKYYYLDPATGVISGTNSTDRPPVNLNVLEK